MTTGAVVEFGRTESPLVIVARCTALRFSGGSVKHHRGGAYLVFARSRPQRVARRTAHAFMPRMAEAADVAGRCVYGSRAPLLMAGRTSVNVRPFFSHRLRYVRFRAVALQTGRVGVLASRDREPDALLGRFVARRAVGVRPVFSVIEFSAERCQAGELLHSPRLGIRMADRAHLAALRIFEMRNVTARARRVVLRPRETHFCG